MRNRPGEWLWCYLPLMLWIGVIFNFSTSSFSSVHTESAILGLLRGCFPSLLGHLAVAQIDFLNFCVRKLAHLTEYAILAALVRHACGYGRPERARFALRMALLIAAVVAATDEAHQALVPDRTSAVGDALIDTCGAAVAVVLLWYNERRRTKCPSTLASLNS